MKKCPYCGRDNEDTAPACPGCGTDLATPAPPEDQLQPENSASSLVIVRTFGSVAQASVLLARLEANGIEAWIPEEYGPQVFSNVLPLGEVTVRVAAQDLEAAQRIADAGPDETWSAPGDAAELPEEATPTPPPHQPRKRLNPVLAYVFAGVVVVVFLAMLVSEYHSAESELLLHTGIADSKAGKLALAVSNLTQAIRISPADPRAYNYRGYVYARLDETDKALSDWSAALRLSHWKLWYCVGTLGAAYAETGDFELALKFQKQALAMGKLSPKARAEAEERIALYQKHQPYREEPSR